ncbi:MAG: hypothetical protein MI919_32030 [Holophagales bacterium]|nr:hypothetical protein [Holophagales bacterium]
MPSNEAPTSTTSPSPFLRTQEEEPEMSRYDHDVDESEELDPPEPNQDGAQDHTPPEE